MRKWRGVYGHALARIDVHVVQTRANRAWGRGGRKEGREREGEGESERKKKRKCRKERGKMNDARG